MKQNIHTIVRSINKELMPQFEEKLRSYLVQQDKEWLIEQIVRLTLDVSSLQAKDIQANALQKAQERAERIARIKNLELNEEKLDAFIKKYEKYDRERLLAEGYLIDSPPEKGTDLIRSIYRSEKGNELLVQAKDILFALLFGDESTNTTFNRVERELLTFTLPRFKSEPLNFMKATTEISGSGTWQDPESVSNDSRANNVILQVEYGEVTSERIGDGIVETLRLVNNLEVNEQILYARMINVEQSTLIS